MPRINVAEAAQDRHQKNKLVLLQDTNKVLAISRIMVAWQPVGICAGVFDMCVRYVDEREQFGAPLGAFQLVQVHTPCLQH